MVAGGEREEEVSSGLGCCGTRSLTPKPHRHIPEQASSDPAPAAALALLLCHPPLKGRTPLPPEHVLSLSPG